VFHVVVGFVVAYIRDCPPRQVPVRLGAALFEEQASAPGDARVVAGASVKVKPNVSRGRGFVPGGMCEGRP
jgi:hypothetical protein